MQNSQTPTEHRDLLNTQSGQDTKDKESYPLLEREELHSTPFHIVGNINIGYKLTWGKYSLTEDVLKTKDDVLTWYQLNKWKIVLHMISIGISLHEEKKTEKNSTL